MAKLRNPRPGVYEFKCPGCGHLHCFYTKESNYVHAWEFNGNMDNPTFTPSLLNRNGKYADPNFIDTGNISTQCHLHVTNGKIQYCQDCTHSYNGKIIDMVDFEDNFM